jgi:hypothetical protein
MRARSAYLRSGENASPGAANDEGVDIAAATGDSLAIADRPQMAGNARLLNSRSVRMHHPIDRRRFLSVVAAGAASALALGCAGGDSTSEADSLARPELLVALGADAVRDLGRRYREAVPAERDAASLRAAILSSRPWTARLGLGRTSVADQVRADFAEQRTVIVGGWLLSTTEARQCALYAALHG